MLFKISQQSRRGARLARAQARFLLKSAQPGQEIALGLSKHVVDAMALLGRQNGESQVAAQDGRGGLHAAARQEAPALGFGRVRAGGAGVAIVAQVAVVAQHHPPLLPVLSHLSSLRQIAGQYHLWCRP